MDATPLQSNAQRGPHSRKARERTVKISEMEGYLTLKKGKYTCGYGDENPVTVGVGVFEGVNVAVGVLVFVGVFDGVSVGVNVVVDEGVNVGVKVAVLVAVSVEEGVYVAGWNGVSVMVGVGVSVGVSEAVPVRIAGVELPVGVKRPKVAVGLGVMGVLEAVGVTAFGLGANCTAIHPRQ